MTMTFNSIERIGEPFSSVAELGLVIPRESEVLVTNTEVKLLFILQGTCIQAIENVGSFKVNSGDIFILPRVCRQHYWLSVPSDPARMHFLKITLSIPTLPAPGSPVSSITSEGDPEGDLTAFARHHFAEIRHLPDSQDANVRELMLAIRREAQEHLPGIRHRVRALCTNLLVHVARRLHEAPASAITTDIGHGFVVNQVKEFLLRNYRRNLRLAEIAWHVKKSEEHLSRVFRKVTGQTVFDYLRTIRMENAKTLLIDSDQTLSEIARETGFTSLSLFSRNFRQYVGNTPSNYREQRAQEVSW